MKYPEYIKPINTKERIISRKTKYLNAIAAVLFAFPIYKESFNKSGEPAFYPASLNYQVNENENTYKKGGVKDSMKIKTNPEKQDKLGIFIKNILNKDQKNDKSKYQKPKSIQDLINEMENIKMPELKTEQLNILSMLDTNTYVRFMSPLNARKIIKHANENIDGIPKYVWIQNFIDDMYINKKLNYFNTYEKVEILKEIILGILTQESKFDDSAISKSNARGAFQITPIAWKDNVAEANKKAMPWHISIKDDFKKATHDFKLSAKIALNYLDKRIPKIVGKNAEYVANKALTNESEKEKFIYYMFINAYNTGPTLISYLLKKFANYISRKNIKFDYAYDLFVEFSEFAKKQSKLYGKDASTYVANVLSGAKALKELGLTDKYPVLYAYNSNLKHISSDIAQLESRKTNAN